MNKLQTDTIDKPIWYQWTEREVLAYTAGILDGEGYIGMVRGYKRIGRKNPSAEYSLVMTVGMTNIEPLRLLQVLFGGNLRQMKPDNVKGKAVYTWNADSRDVCFEVTKILRGRLLIKSAQLELAHLYLTSIKSGDKDPELREAFYFKFRVLNKTGATLD